MNNIAYSLPPAGSSLPKKYLFRTALSWCRNDGDIKPSFLHTPGFHILTTSSGTSALYLGLKTLKRLSNKKKVILPAYSCPQIIAAVCKAGLEPILCDVEPRTLGMIREDLNDKATSEVLAVIGVDLYGIPENMSNIKAHMKEKGIFVIEDSAQAFPSPSQSSLADVRYQGHDTSPDMIVYSFSRGKPFGLLYGGAILFSDENVFLAGKEIYSNIKEEDHAYFIVYFIRTMIYSIFFNPYLYWIPENIPWLKLGETLYRTDFKSKKMPKWAFHLGNEMIHFFEEIAMIRRKLEAIYTTHLARFKEEFILFPGNIEEHHILSRYPIIFKNKEVRNRILDVLKHAGLGATGSYPAPLDELEEIKQSIFLMRNHPNAKMISERILTLPLHEKVRTKDICNIEKIFEKYL